MSKTKREQILELLAMGTSQVDTAKATGVAHKTIWQWLQKPDFAAEVEKRRTELLNEWKAGLRLMIPSAMQALQDVLNSNNAAAKIKAIDLLARMVGLMDMESSKLPDKIEISFNPIGMNPDEKDAPDDPEITP